MFIKERRKRAQASTAKQKKYNRLIDRMKELNVPGELWREVTSLWDKDEEKALSLLTQKGYAIKPDELYTEDVRF